MLAALGAAPICGQRYYWAIDVSMATRYFFTMTRAKPTKQTIRAFVRDVPGLSEDDQRALATAAGATVFYGPGELDGWLRALGPGQTGWVWSLTLLPEPAEAGSPRPSAMYAKATAFLMHKCGEGARFVEGRSGATSDDRDEMLLAIQKAAGSIARGRKLTTPEATAMGAKGLRVQQQLSAKARLRRPAYRAYLPSMLAIWHDTKGTPTREAAADAINDILLRNGLDRLGAWPTLRRAFGVNRDGTPVRKSK